MAEDSDSEEGRPAQQDEAAKNHNKYRRDKPWDHDGIDHWKVEKWMWKKWTLGGRDKAFVISI